MGKTALLIAILLLALQAASTQTSATTQTHTPSETDNPPLTSNTERLLWSYKTGSWVVSVAWSPDGSKLAAGSADRRVYVLYVLNSKVAMLIVSCQPSCQVYVDGELLGSAPVEVYVAPGRHEVCGRFLGYTSCRVVDASGDVEVHLVMWEPLLIAAIFVAAASFAAYYGFYGSVEVVTEPEGAAVYVDGRRVGRAPVKVRVRRGRHQISAYKSGYYPASTKVNVGGRTRVELVLKLKPTKLIVRAPEFARVLVDGVERGRGRVEVEVEPGVHEVRVVADGYRAWEERVDIEPGSTVSVSASLEPLPATLVMESEPRGAVVYVDGRRVGVAPVRVQVGPGAHEVRVVAEGFAQWVSEVRVGAGEERVVVALLKPVKGFLSVLEPRGAVVYVDGKRVGEAPVKVVVDPGEHGVVVEAKGYRRWARRVKVRAGEEVVVRAELARRPSPSEVVAALRGRGLRVKPVKPGYVPEEFRYEIFGFRVIGRLGISNFVTLLAERDGELYVLKVPTDVYDMLCKGARPRDFTVDEYVFRRLRREYEALRSIRHPNVVEVRELIQLPAIVMEYCPYGDLGYLVNERGTLRPRDALEVGIALLDALALAHDRGVVHRDVKPSNILLDAKVVPKLGDFDAARIASLVTRTSRGGFTLGFASPEQVREGRSGPLSDVFGLAATLYWLVSRRYAYPRKCYFGEMDFEKHEPTNPGLPEEAWEPIRRALSVEDRERPSAAKLRDMLAEAYANLYLV